MNYEKIQFEREIIDFLRSFMQFQHHNIASDKWSDQINWRFYHVKQTVENRRPSNIGDVATLLFVHFNFIIQLRNICFIPEINPHCILSQIYALFIEFYYALFLFLFFKDMYYNTMIHTFCILKKMTFSTFHYLTLSVRCEELDAHIN
jgi:hypothetical protein